jgi:hypothetical protein
MKVEVVKDNSTGQTTLQIEVPLTLAKQSRSGNSTVIATTRGQQFIGKINGQDTYLQLNVLQMETTGGLEIKRVKEPEVEAGEGGTGRRKAA